MQGINTRTTNCNATSLSVNAEASKMLEAALEQMDGIISGSGSGAAQNTPATATATATTVGGGGSHSIEPLNELNHSFVMHERSVISAANVLSTAKTLALALQQVGPSSPTPDLPTANIIRNWLESCMPRRDADERLRCVQHEKDALGRQYQQLGERVSMQTERIADLERELAQKIQELSSKDDELQRQTMQRSSLETKNLELLTALSEAKLQRAALELENSDLRAIEARLENFSIAEQLPSVPRRLPFGSVGNLNQIGGGAASSVGGGDGGRAPKTPPALLRHQIHPQFHSLPRTHATAKQHNNNNNNNNNNINTNNKNNTINNNNRSMDDGGGGGGSGGGGSALKPMRNVAFASNEKILIDDSRSAHGGDGGFSSSMNGSFISQQNSTPSPTLKERSAKGFLQIFGKLRRSNSGNLELPSSMEQSEAEFKRGGIARATAGGRIEWSPSPSQQPVKKPYTDWTPQEVCNWLGDLGLAIYEEDCRKWLRANPQICFFTASPVDIEKELNIKFALHRKKIYLASDELTGREHDELALKAAKLNVNWVMRWLDDIGLPQYKDTFQKAKVDGRILHRLTMEDLSLLNVTSCLHVASLRSGIQCMREMSWNPDCLIRRSCGQQPVMRAQSENDSDGIGAPDDSWFSDSTEHISLWTAHRVMEWLRMVDLSEYAPNLRGAGVHGALMLYENRFNAALLADLLSIPPYKTLLRRHLATHFKELVGSHCIHLKRDAEDMPGYQPLTIASKIKAPKKTQFSLKRRRSTKGSGDSDWTDYVCPMSMSMCLGSGVRATQTPLTMFSAPTNAKTEEDEELVPQQAKENNGQSTAVAAASAPASGNFTYASK